MSPKSFESRVHPWIIVEENKEYSTTIFELLKRRMRLETENDFAEGDFYILDAPPWTNVIPITPKGEVILVEQFRYGTEDVTIEIPGGLVDPGEKPIEAARRELREETGYRSEKWSNLGKVSSNPSIQTNYTHFFIAEDCKFVGVKNRDEHERIEVRSVPMNEFLAMVRDGTIDHSLVVAAVAKLLLNKNEELGITN